MSNQNIYCKICYSLHYQTHWCQHSFIPYDTFHSLYMKMIFFWKEKFNSTNTHVKWVTQIDFRTSCKYFCLRRMEEKFSIIYFFHWNTIWSMGNRLDCHISFDMCTDKCASHFFPQPKFNSNNEKRKNGNQ